MVDLMVWVLVNLGVYFAVHFQYMDKFWGFCVWVVTTCYAVAVWLRDAVIHTFQLLVSTIFTAIGSSPCGSGISDVLAMANTFFPVDETLQMMATLMIAVWLPVGLYRFVKSWIPTLTGG